MSALAGTPDIALINNIITALGPSIGKYVIESVLRASFFIELVQHPKIETTKFRVRWTEEIDTIDPRHASYNECVDVFDSLVSDLMSAIEDIDNRALLSAFQSQRLLSYELPIDYVQRKVDTAMHRSENIYWIWDDLPRHVVKLREILRSRVRSPVSSVLSDAYGKIKVKTYLTDRVLTGEYKTNREKRWEAHPASVHFALRKNCMEIEYTLLSQLCHFNGFPEDIKHIAEGGGLLLPIESPFRCPITKDPLVYSEFENEVRDPTHGKSAFQVGHLNPLKANHAGISTGHNAENISWISQDGNRIQGSLSLEETRQLIMRIFQNYERAADEQVS